jgi:S1-C subfamily serine protease
VLGLCLLVGIASVSVGRDPPTAASTSAVQQPPPAQQGPSQPLPAQPPPAPAPGVGQQAAQMAQQAAAVEGNPDWAVTLERIASSVVSINIDATRAFDTEWNATAQATGFVVDAERGLILTNRHVVTPGPVTAEATFLNREEVQLYPVYRDPIHDFGFYHYDPSKLHFIKPKALIGSR